VVERREAQEATKAQKGHKPKSLGYIPTTVTRKVATDLGITDEAVRYRVKNAV